MKKNKESSLFEDKKLKSGSAENIPIQAPSNNEMQKLIDYYQNGQLDDAERLAKSITEQFSYHSFGWKVLGAVFERIGKKPEALDAMQRAVQLKEQDDEAHNNLGVALQERGRLEEAEVSYRQAILLNADYTESYYNLGNTLKELGKLDEAEASYRKAISLENDFADAHNNLGIILKELGKLNDAETSFRQAIFLKPGFVEPTYGLGILLYEGKKFEKAAEQFMLIDFRMSKVYLLRCFYMQDERTKFYHYLDNMLKKGENNALIGSLICGSNIRYGIDKYNPFCSKPLMYVLETNLLDQCDFKTVFIDSANEILGNQKVQKKTQDLLTKGVQTSGNVFFQAGAAANIIQDIIHFELEKYRICFQDSKEGLITNWPKDYQLNGWLISMKSGGELNSHMHERGWISGSIYINVTPKVNSDSGNLVLELGNVKNELGEGKNKKSINVVTGSLCLFPSSLHHYTIPFVSEENRIVLAFDVIPKN